MQYGSSEMNGHPEVEPSGPAQKKLKTNPPDISDKVNYLRFQLRSLLSDLYARLLLISLDARLLLTPLPIRNPLCENRW